MDHFEIAYEAKDRFAISFDDIDQGMSDLQLRQLAIDYALERAEQSQRLVVSNVDAFVAWARAAIEQRKGG